MRPLGVVCLLSALALAALFWAPAADARPAAGDREARSFPPGDTLLKALHDPSGWEVHLRAAREGVDVFKKDIDGVRIPGFRGEKVVAASSDSLFSLLVDLNNHVRISKRIPLVISEVISSSGNTLEFFQLVATPSWTMARDRCWFNRAEILRNVDGEAGRHRLTWKGLDPAPFSEYLEKVLVDYPNALVIPLSVGSWEVVPIGPKSTRLIYRVLTDPGGKIPANLQELVTGRTLPDNLLQFETAAAERAAK